MSERQPRVGETITRVVNVATGFTVECCAVTGVPVPPELRDDETAKQGWLRVNAARVATARRAASRA